MVHETGTGSALIPAARGVRLRRLAPIVGVPGSVAATRSRSAIRITSAVGAYRRATPSSSQTASDRRIRPVRIEAHRGRRTLIATHQRAGDADRIDGVALREERQPLGLREERQPL